MRHLFAIIALLCATVVGASAQSVRLGEPLPTVNVTPDIDDAVAMYNRDYTCLIFVHSESQPCVEALRNFKDTAKSIEKQCAIVFITSEQESDKEAIVERLGIEDYNIAFDHNNRTFKAFGIQYAPFVVIYRNKNSRIEWFGPIHHLGGVVIDRLNQRQKYH